MKLPLVGLIHSDLFLMPFRHMKQRVGLFYGD